MSCLITLAYLFLTSMEAVRGRTPYSDRTFWHCGMDRMCQSVRSLYGFWPLTASMVVKNKYAYVIMQDICNKFIEVIFLRYVWFLGQIVYFKIELPSTINKMQNNFFSKILQIISTYPTFVVFLS